LNHLQHYDPMNSNEITVEILIPGQKCGLIIGKKGETIHKLQENSGTEMQLIQDSKIPNEQGKSLRITGLPAKVKIAKRMVKQLLDGEDNRMPNGPATGANQIQVNQVKWVGRVIVPRSAVGLIVGRGGESIKRISQESGAQVQFEQDDNSSPLECCAILNGSKFQVDRAMSIIHELVKRSNAEVQKLSITMLVPISKTCLVIGRKGEVIKKINRETGARVDMSRDSPIDAVNNLFVIKGNTHQIQSAKEAILAQISDKEGDVQISNQDEHQQGVQTQEVDKEGSVNDYGQQEQASYQNSEVLQAHDQLSVESSKPLSIQQKHEGQIQKSTNPTTDQIKYSVQWIEYYRSFGMHDKADEIERLRDSQNGQ